MNCNGINIYSNMVTLAETMKSTFDAFQHLLTFVAYVLHKKNKRRCMKGDGLATSVDMVQAGSTSFVFILYNS